MNSDFLLILAIIVVSWVIFVFNFVLGYYIGRAVEAGEKTTKRKKENSIKKQSSKNFSFPLTTPSIGTF